MRGGRFRYSLWDDANRRHILAEGEDHPERELFEEDIDEVLLETHHPHIVTSEYEVNEEARVQLLGMTAFDRVLLLVIVPKPFDAARPIHARDATESEETYYRAWVKQRKK
jgi:uncharacterized DUF497 family protein